MVARATDCLPRFSIEVDAICDGLDKHIDSAVLTEAAFKMSVRVVARIRPLLKAETEKDIIVQPGTSSDSSRPSSVSIPDPKRPQADFSFNFNSVYDRDASQQELFESEGEKLAFLQWRTLTDPKKYLPQSHTSSRASMSRSLLMASLALAKRTLCEEESP